MAFRQSFQVLVGNANVDWVVAVGPRIAQAHATGSATTANNPLQQGAAFAGRTGPSCVIASHIIRQLSLVRHELFPLDVRRVGILETDRPVLRRNRHRPDPIASGFPPQPRRAPPTTDVSPSLCPRLQYLD